MPNGAGIWGIPAVSRPIQFNLSNWGPTTGLAELMKYRQMQLRAAAAAARASRAGGEGDPRLGAYRSIPKADGSGEEEQVWVYGKSDKERNADYASKLQTRVAEILAKDKPLQDALEGFADLSVEGKEERLTKVRGEAERLSKATRMDPVALTQQLTRGLRRDIEERKNLVSDAGVLTQIIESIGTGVSELKDAFAMTGESGAERLARGKAMNERRDEATRNNAYADELARREKEGRSNAWMMLTNPGRTALLKAGELLPELGATLAAQVGGAMAAGPVGFMGAGGLVGGITAGAEQVRRLAADPNLTDEEKLAQADSAWQQGAAIGGGVGAIPAGPSVAVSRGLTRRAASKLMAETPTLTREAATEQALRNAAAADAKRTFVGRSARAYPGIAMDAATLGIGQQVGQNIVHGNVTGQPVNFGEGLIEQGLAGLIMGVPLAPLAGRRAMGMPGSNVRRMPKDAGTPEAASEAAPATEVANAATAETPVRDVDYILHRLDNNDTEYPPRAEAYEQRLRKNIEAGEISVSDLEAAVDQFPKWYAEQYDGKKPNNNSFRIKTARKVLKEYKEANPDATDTSAKAGTDTAAEPAGRPEGGESGTVPPMGENGQAGEGGANRTDTSPDSAATAHPEADASAAADRVSEQAAGDGATPKERGNVGAATQDTRPTPEDAGAPGETRSPTGESVRDSGLEPTAPERAAAGESNGSGEPAESAGRPGAQDAETTGSRDNVTPLAVDENGQVHVNPEKIKDLPTPEDLDVVDAGEFTQRPDSATATPETALQSASIRTGKAHNALSDLTKNNPDKLVGDSKGSIFSSKKYTTVEAYNAARRALFDEAWSGKSNAIAKKLHDAGVPKMEINKPAIEAAMKKQEAITLNRADPYDTLFPMTPEEAQYIVQLCAGKF